MRGGLGAARGMPSWVESRLLDKDYAGARFFLRGAAYLTEADINTATGTAKSGETRITGPVAIGDELFVNGNPVADTTGWTSQNSALLSAVGGELVVDANGGTNATGYHSVPTTASHAYRVTAKYRRGTSASNATVNVMTSGGTARNAMPNNTATSDVENSVTFGAEGSTMNIGLRIPATGATGTVIGSEFRCTECLPLVGFTPASFAARIAFTTPASVASDQCLIEAHGNNQNKITTVLRSSDSHLVVTVTFGNSAAATLDLGAISLGAAHVLEMSHASNRFMASLDGGAVVGDTVGTMPGIAVIYEGRSNTGQTWSGTIERVTVYDGEFAPVNAISMDGDSYSSVSGSGGVSGQALLATSTGRPVFSTGVGGSTLAEQVARVVANPGLYRGVFVHIDGDANGYGDLATDMALYAQMADALGHGRFVIVPPFQRANKTTEANAATLALSNALLTAYPGNAVDGWAILAAQAVSPGDDATVAAGQIPASMLQGDGTHLTSAGMDYLTDAIAAFIAGKSW